MMRLGPCWARGHFHCLFCKRTLPQHSDTERTSQFAKGSSLTASSGGSSDLCTSFSNKTTDPTTPLKVSRAPILKPQLV
ncbi:hypothetical protein MHYP_G00091620 [Metynnis hypsauchen]